MATDLQNWAKNFTYGAAGVHRPGSVEEVQELVRATPKVRALGTRHSFNSIADTTHELISTERLDGIEPVDAEARTVSVQAGVSYGRLSPELDRQGFAVPNLASLPHISVVGACATATHGSGVTNQNLANSVRELEVVLADGSLRTFRRGDKEFDGAVVGLGGLGIATRITLDLVPSFEVAQTVYERLPFSQVENRFDEVMSGGYSVSLFWDWASPEINQVWVKRKAGEGSAEVEYFGAKAATRKLHPLPDLSAENCTEQLGVSGPWYERLPHFRVAFTPSSGEELQSEFFVERRQAAEAIGALTDLASKISPLLFITEIRTIASDGLWMSPNYERESVGIHFTWRQMIPEVMEIIPQIEAKLLPFRARPHWGKLFTTPGARIAELYEKIGDFRDLLVRLDPDRKFENRFLAEKIFG